MVSPLAVANYFLEKSFETGQVLSPMKLVKLVYIAHGWHLALTSKPLIDEPVQAWQYGPVIKSIYDEFKSYGSGAITRLGSEAVATNNMFGFITPKVEDPKLKLFLDRIWDVYHRYSAIQLSTLTHQIDTPWYRVWNNLGGKLNKSSFISNEMIAEHYKQKAQNPPLPLQNI
jgi:uncharacterized phage-associated protein